METEKAQSSESSSATSKRRGRPKGSVKKASNKLKRKRGRPKGSSTKQNLTVKRNNKRGRPARKQNFNSVISDGIHRIGQLLIIDAKQLDITEVLFAGKNRPKIR